MMSGRLLPVALRIGLLMGLFMGLLIGCGGGGSGSSSNSNPPPPSSADNVLSLSVNGALCSANSYPNKACVSVTICAPGSTQCQTISDILLDTGSYGLRIFKQALNVPLEQATIGSNPVAECVQYGDGTSQWGPVQRASVILGNEPAVQLPVQVIDAGFASLPTGCGNADLRPSDAGFNGILGVGFFAQDCGQTCADSPANGIYYTCNGAACSGTSVPLSAQVQNPVMLLPQDNNGLVINLPAVAAGGAPFVDGSVVFGIGTRSNNGVSAVAAYAADRQGNFITTFGGRTYTAFIDSGSNGLFFGPPDTALLTQCPSPNSAWFCPSSTAHLTATTAGYSGSPNGTVNFDIGNFESLLKSSNLVFPDIGGFQPRNFDWGMPFFFGRTIYVGFDGRTSLLGSGPYWAY
ncbi:MAG: DUF3443 domain-containing protein [Nitrospiraceae bacterium]|nr:DUF3443 domain-containing protein [Nitrospiraceae bacterium]